MEHQSAAVALLEVWEVSPVPGTAQPCCAHLLPGALWHSKTDTEVGQQKQPHPPNPPAQKPFCSQGEFQELFSSFDPFKLPLQEDRRGLKTKWQQNEKFLLKKNQPGLEALS